MSHFAAGIKALSLILICFIFALKACPQEQTTDLTVSIKGLKAAKEAKLFVALHKVNSQGFPHERNAFAKRVVPVSASEELIRFSNIPSGVYAVSVFEDSNGNDKIDSNPLGAPKEPFGVSNNIKTKMRPPNFKECSFSVASPGKRIEIIMN